MSREERILVIGGGSWGMALANLLAEAGEVTLWEFFSDIATKLQTERTRPEVLPGIMLHNAVTVTNDVTSAIEGISLVLFVVPSHVLRNTALLFAQLLPPTLPIASATKGIEAETLLFSSQILSSILGEGHSYATISGPSHAEEVARQLPTTVVVASRDTKLSQQLQNWLIRPYFRVYTSTDITGVELGAAMKNVIAIAAGICSALGFGDNAIGALLTRGLAEITRLGKAMGAELETFMGLAGLGDLITTCISKHSRNRMLGERIGKGEQLDKIVENMTMVAEGVRTVEAALKLGNRYGVELPITTAISEVFHGEIPPNMAAERLMTRELKPEVYI